MGPRHPHRPGGRRPARPRKPRQAQPSTPGLLPFFWQGSECFQFDQKLVAYHVNREGVPLPLEAAPLAAAIAACPFQALVSACENALITIVWQVPDVLPAPWPQLPVFPDFALHEAIKQMALGNALLVIGNDEASVRAVLQRIAARVYPPGEV